MSKETFILFELAEAMYAVRSQEVLHVEMLEHVAPVPRTAKAVEGVVFSRGQVIPAIDLRTRFGLPRRDPTPRTRLIVLAVDDRRVGLIVDAAREFRAVPADSLRPIDETLHGLPGHYLRGVFTDAGRMVLILDLHAVLALEALPAPAEV